MIGLTHSTAFQDIAINKLKGVALVTQRIMHARQTDVKVDTILAIEGGI